MIRPQGIAAYVLSGALSGIALATTIEALHRPWLANRAGDVIALTKYCIGELCDDFPSREFCSARSGFCGGWKTATFGLAIAVGLELLAVLAIIYSWMSGRRKRTVIVLDILVTIALIVQFIAFAVLVELYASADYFKYGGWDWAGPGRYHLLASLWSLILLKFLLARFRRLVKGPEAEEEYDSDYEDDDDVDAVSIDEDVAGEDRDFHQFNKQARREALRQAEGGRPASTRRSADVDS